MSNLQWFKHDKNASFNDKMAELLNHEGSKGYGAYWYIIEMIYMQSRQKVHFNYLKSIERHGFSQSYMKKIITCYGLFVVEDDCFYPIISHSSLDNRTSKKTSNEPTTRQQPTHEKAASEDQPTHDKVATEDQPTHDKAATEDQLTHDKATTEDQPTHDKATTEDQLTHNKPTNEHFPRVEDGSNSLIISKDAVASSLARATRVRIDKNRTDKIRIEKNRIEQIRLTSSSEKEKEKEKRMMMMMMNQAWDDCPSKLGKPPVKAGTTARQSWANRPSKLGRRALKAGKTGTQSWEDGRSKLGRQALKAGKTICVLFKDLQGCLLHPHKELSCFMAANSIADLRSYRNRAEWKMY